MKNDITHTDSSPASADDIDALYDELKPRFSVARRSYVRKRVGFLLAAPILVVASLAWALPSEPEQVSQLANGGDRETIDVPQETEIIEPAKVDTEPEETEATKPEPVQDTISVDLGFPGSAKIARSGTSLMVLSLDLNDGWHGEVLELGTAATVEIILEHNAVRLVATIGLDDDGEPTVDVVDADPAPDVVTRKEIDVGDVGRVVVEREGDELWLGVLWSHDWWAAKVTSEHGDTVKASFSNDGTTHFVEAWIEESEINHRIWDEKEPVPEPTPKPESDEPKKDKEKEPEEEPEPEIQTRKEIEVGDVGRVVVERDGDKLWLGVLWSHQWWDDVVVTEHGAEVHAYFTNDGFEHHVRAWIKGAKIKHEKWVVEPEIQAYDGSVGCELGAVGVLVEGNVARVMSVQEVEGVEATILIEVGEVVRVRFETEEGTWILDAWGNGSEVLHECGPAES